MGLFGWGDKDTSTPQERKDWRDNAQKQIDQQNGKTQKPARDKEPTGPTRHARKRGLFS